MTSSRILSASLLLPLALVACTPTPAPAPEARTDVAPISENEVVVADNEAVASIVPGTGTALTVALETRESEDDQSTITTTATLRFAGAVSGTLILPTILGQLNFVDPGTYGPSEYAEETDAVVVAVLSAWWAGSGEEIRITHHRGETPSLAVEHRFGNEGTAEDPGQCTPAALLGEMRLPRDATIILTGFGEAAPSSALDYCNDQDDENIPNMP